MGQVVYMTTRGRKAEHPHWQRWLMLRRRKVLCTQWHDDFWAFADGIGDSDGRRKLQRPRASEPFGPTNFQWAEPFAGERAAAYLKEWRQNNQDAVRESWLRRKYGIGVADYEAMLEAQGGVCAICGEAEQRFTIRKGDGPNRLCVDHDHETGAPRALLCADCNVGLGAFGENMATLAKAIGYLRKHSMKTG